MSAEQSFVITLQFDPATFAWLQALRTEHFPPERNWLPAHLTLLHRASMQQADQLKLQWHGFRRTVPPILSFAGYRSLGGGTALAVHSPGLEAVRRQIMQVMGGTYSRQDLQPFKPHVTIQNKVEPAVARSLLDELSASFVSREGKGVGVMVWRYLGGPWELDCALAFAE